MNSGNLYPPEAAEIIARSELARLTGTPAGLDGIHSTTGEDLGFAIARLILATDRAARACPRRMNPRWREPRWRKSKRRNTRALTKGGNRP